MIESIKQHPMCEECQCYPECRQDCADWQRCVERLPEYAERCYGSDQSKWPEKVRLAWFERGYKLMGDYVLRDTKRDEAGEQP